MGVYRILSCRQVLEYHFNRVSHLGLYHRSHDSQMFLVFGSLFPLGECGIGELPVNRLLVFTADKTRTRYRVTRGEPVGDYVLILLQPKTEITYRAVIRVHPYVEILVPEAK